MIDDERARVPFALVGVVLLLGSVTFTASVQPERPLTEPSVDVAMDRGTAETRTALRTSVRSAAGAAAREPVVARANTSAGRVLDPDEPFRDALRVRIYLEARERLGRLRVERGDVTVTASLPPTPTPTALRAAKRRVHLQPAGGNATALQVRVENVTLRAERGGRTVARTEWAPKFVVRTPVLALHDRIERFDRRLNHGLGRPGLARKLTGYAYALTWARGYAQYAGAPVENVLGTGHLSVLTNAALLREQQAAFGRSDAAGRRGVARAAVELALSKFSMPVPRNPGLAPGQIIGEPPVPAPDAGSPSLLEDREGPSPGDEMRVGVNRTADRALARLTRSGNLTAALRAAYTANVRMKAEVRSRRGPGPGPPPSPSGGSWRRTDCRTETRVTGTERASRSPRTAASGDWHVLDAYAVDATQEQTRVCTWKQGNSTTTTGKSATVEYSVDLAVLGRHVGIDGIPNRGFETVHRRTESGPYPGTDFNLAGIRDRAVGRVIDDAGGPGGVAARAVEGELDTGAVRIEGERPDRLRRWVLRDLVAFRSDLRSVSTTVRRGCVGTFETNPAGELAELLDRRRAGLVAAPERYESAAQRARIAARVAYLEATLDLLESRRDAHRNRRQNLDGVLNELDAGSAALFERALDNRTMPGTEVSETVEGVNVTAVSGSPAYLTTGTVSGERAESPTAAEEISPLATRNVNVFTNPAGDVTDLLFDRIDPGSAASFRSGARVLDAAETVSERSAANRVRGLQTRRRALRGELEASVEHVRAEHVRMVLRDAGVGDDDRERAEIVEAGLSRWETVGERALALDNGSAAEPIAATAAPHNGTKRALLQSRLRASLAAATREPATRVPRELVNNTTSLVRKSVERQVDRYAERGIERAVNDTATRVGERFGRGVNRVPAGLPLLPLGTPWWATANAWYVEVRGGYDRFAVSTRSGAPDRPGGSLTYVRDGGAVRIDYDGDGTTERFGRAERVSFTVETGVVVAVPPGPQGVGDVDGNADERSPGWSAWAGIADDRQVPWTDQE